MFIAVNASMTDTASLLSIRIYVTCMLMARYYTTLVYIKYTWML